LLAIALGVWMPSDGASIVLYAAGAQQLGDHVSTGFVHHPCIHGFAR
jgi:hypothetical protein